MLRIEEFDGQKSAAAEQELRLEQAKQQFWRLREMRAATERKNFIRLPHSRRQKNRSKKRGF